MRAHHLALLAAASLAVAACTDAPTAPRALRASLAASSAPIGGVFVSTNAVAGNAVVAFARTADGTLRYTGTYPTGGAGIGGTTDPLASQYALTLSRDARFLFVVNAGSDEVSSFAVGKDGLTLVSTVASGGTRPVSVAAGAHVLYVLDAGNNAVSSFDISPDGALTAHPSLGAALGAGAAGAAAVRLSPDGRFLAVSERASNRIDTYRVGADGALSGLTMNADPGVVPFGFDYTTRGQLVISEAGSGSASSFAQANDGSLAVVSGAVPTLQGAPCWLIVDNSGRFAYTANAATSSITGFAVDARGTLTRLAGNGVTADLGAGAQPLDLDMSRDGRFLYVLENGTGSIAGFAQNGDGSLRPLGTTGGLAARSGFMGLAAY